MLGVLAVKNGGERAEVVFLDRRHELLLACEHVHRGRLGWPLLQRVLSRLLSEPSCVLLRTIAILILLFVTIRTFLIIFFLLQLLVDID